MTLVYNFPTIDLCVDFLVSKGCPWNYEKEQKLIKKSIYEYKDYLVLYDPYEILDVNPY